MEPSDRPRSSAKPSLALRVVGSVALVTYFLFLVSSFWWTGGWISELLRDHYVFFVGIPFAALISYVLVSTLETTRGKIELEALGLKFKGASGPIVMWVLVFLALIVAMRLVWDLH